MENKKKTSGFLSFFKCCTFSSEVKSSEKIVDETSNESKEIIKNENNNNTTQNTVIKVGIDNTTNASNLIYPTNNSNNKTKAIITSKLNNNNIAANSNILNDRRKDSVLGSELFIKPQNHFSNTVLNDKRNRVAIRNKIFSSENLRQDTAVISKVPKSHTHINTKSQIPEIINFSGVDVSNSRICNLININNGELINKDIKLKFNGLGLINNGRNEKDGKIYFTNSLFKNDKIDFNLNTDYFPFQNENEVNSPINSLINKVLFVIYYSPEGNNYNLNFSLLNFANHLLGKSHKELLELYDNYHLYIQVSSITPIQIESKEIIMFGKSLYELIPYENGIVSVIDLRGKILKKSFNPKNCQSITFGINQNCTYVIYDDNDISDYQCEVSYSFPYGCWVLKDGKDGNNSTNGTWIFGMNNYDIFDDMVLSINNQKLQFQFEN